MMRVKDIYYALLILGYPLSSAIALADGMGLFKISPLLAYTCVILGTFGGSIMLSRGIKKFREAKKRGLKIPWYTSPSLALGSAFFAYGLVPVWSAMRFVLPVSQVASRIRLIIEGGIFFAFFAFLLLALIDRHKEE